MLVDPLAALVGLGGSFVELHEIEPGLGEHLHEQFIGPLLLGRDDEVPSGGHHLLRQRHESLDLGLERDGLQFGHLREPVPALSQTEHGFVGDER